MSSFDKKDLQEILKYKREYETIWGFADRIAAAYFDSKAKNDVAENVEKIKKFVDDLDGHDVTISVSALDCGTHYNVHFNVN